MIKIESLNEYINKISNEELYTLASKIYQITDFLNDDYVGYEDWFFNKQLPGLYKGDRNILFIRSEVNKEEIIAMSCLKKDKKEQKICTIFVSNKFRQRGIGSSLIEESMKWLGTTKPLITIADYKLVMFKSLITKYDWKLTEKIDKLYNNHTKELCFNGRIIKKGIN